MENAILTYFLKTAIASALLFGIYWFFLRKDTLFKTKRIYLLFCIFFSAIFPAINLPFSSNEKMQIPAYWISEIVISPSSHAVAEKAISIDWIGWVLIFSVVVSLVLLIRLLIQVLEVFRLKYGNISRSEKHGVYILLPEISSPFSFFRWIFVGNDDWERTACSEIIRHEQVHVSQWHSKDVIFSEIACIVFWWNPLVWLIRREIRVNHEYLADSGVLSNGIEMKRYQYLLLETLTVTNRIPLNNYFNISQLKKRITMMNKKQTSALATVKYLLAVPAMALLLVGNAAQASSLKLAAVSPAENSTMPNSVTTIPDETDTAQDKAGKQITITITEPDSPVTVAEEMPQFPGGNNALFDYLSKNLRYPAEEAKKGIQGRVVLKFVVHKTGKISQVEVIKGFNKALDDEAVRVVQSMPDWKPGRNNEGEAVSVYFTLPIVFKLDNNEKKSSANMPDFSKVLVLVDGKEVTDTDVKGLKPETIESVSVLKDQASIAKYGDRANGKEGVVLITLKK